MHGGKARQRATLVFVAIAAVALLFSGSANSAIPLGRPAGLAGSLDPSAPAAAWTQLPSSADPTLGIGPMTFDAADGYVLLYETVVSFTENPPCAGQQLWKFVDGAWSPLPSASAPKFNTALMVYDPAEERVVLFGGCGTDSNQTWTYADGVWSNLTSPIAPPVREGASMAYDSSTDAVVLFGGYVFTNLTKGTGHYANDTWEFQNGSWHEVPTRRAPPAQDLFGLAADTSSDDLVLVGNGETWTFATGDWTNRSMSVGPSARTSPAFVDDPATHGSVLFGGQGAFEGVAGVGPLLSDTWRFSDGCWQSLFVASAPAPRVGADLAYDPADGDLLLFGGEGASSFLNDTWVVNATLGVTGSACPATSGSAWAYGLIAAGGFAAAAVGALLWIRRRRHPQPRARSR